MDINKPTLAIYGIQDRQKSEHPLYVHDHNLALMKNGKVKNFLQQERISRKKRDNSLHIHLKKILKGKKLIGHDFDLVFVDNVVGRTFLTTDGEVRFEAPLNNKLKTKLEKGKCWWFGDEKEAWVLNHEMAHIFSCLPFFGNFKENSLLVHFDGGASLSNFSAFHYVDGKINPIEYHWDLKPLSTIYNANALVFAILGAKITDQNAVPGKFMGYAGWGTYKPELEKWLIENNFFHDIWAKKSTFFKNVKAKWGVELKSFDQKHWFIKDVAATLQQIFINQTINKLRELKKKSKADYLYYTGGSALNIVANSKIVESRLFTDVFIPPCTEDSGLALGAAAFADWQKHGETEIHSPYLNNWNIESYETHYTKNTIEKVSDSLLQEKIIGICNGFGEAGPRALGNRSIVALANSKKLANKISIEKKGREWYRPLAPVALEKNVKYFTGLNKIHHLSQYMLLEFTVLPSRQNEIEGTVHIDGTARFQTFFNREQNPFIYDLLNHLEKNFGIKALINTSFNANGEPIVHSEEDALVTAKKIKLDGLVVNGNFELLS